VNVIHLRRQVEMTGKHRILFSILVLTLALRGHAADIAITNITVQPSVVQLGWTSATDLCIVAASSSLTTGRFHWVGDVLATNWTSLSNSGACGFYGLRQVRIIAVPDANLRAAILAALPAAHSPTGIVYDIDAEDLASLQASGAGVLDATGVESLTGLTALDISSNDVGTLDVSALASLRVLSCGQNGLTGLDLSLCPNVQQVACRFNALATITASNNPALQSLDCGYNLLAALACQNWPQLRDLRCEFNQLTNLDLTACVNLRSLDCDDNSALGGLILGVSPCTNLSCARGQLTALDLQACTNLATLDCSGNALSALDLTGCPRLQAVSCDANALVTIDLTACPALQSLSCGGNLLSSIDLLSCDNLQYIYADDNLVSDLSSFESLTHLQVLSLVNNPVSDLTPLINLASGSFLIGCQVYLSGPDIDMGQVETLRGYGVDVYVLN
jgi:Leucine-rich repeat (LRR) protein